MPRIVAPNVGREWAAWTVAASPLCTGLAELDEHWTIEDIADALEFFDVEGDASRIRGKIAESLPKQGDTIPLDLTREPPADAQATADEIVAFSQRTRGMTFEELLAELDRVDAEADEVEP